MKVFLFFTIDYNGTGGSSPGGKWPRNEADHSPPSSAKVKNA